MRENKSFKGYIETLNEISKAITSDLYLEDILKLIVELTANVMGTKICALWLLDKKSGELKIRATQAISREYLKDRTIKIGEGVVGLVAKEKKAVTILDVMKSPEYKEKGLARKEGLSSMASVPMIVKKRVIGVINCYTTKKYKFTKSDISLLSTVANQAAVAIENTELMVKTKVIQEELEARKKIEKAKGILMRQQGISEEDAYGLIRKSSMDNRIHMRDVAEAIILSHNLTRLKK